MSIERIKRKGSVVWRVRWRDNSGREHSRVLGRKRDAESFDAEIRRRKRAGDLDVVDASKQTLAEFVEEWWRLYAQPNLAPATLKLYAMLWDKHVLPQLGALRLRDLTPERIEQFRARLVAAGAGPVSIRRALVLLQGVLQRAVEWQRIPHNPARLVRKPPAGRRRAVRAIAPETIERMRAWLLERGQHWDAVLLSLLAYSGLRPGEALALTWGHLRERTLLVEQAVSHGEGQGDKDRPDTHGAPAQAARLGSERMATCIPTTGRKRPAVPGLQRRLLEPRRLGELADTCFRSRCCGRRPREDASVRPPPQLLLASDPRGRHGRRGCAAARSRADDDAQHIRTRLRRAPGRRAVVRRGADPQSTRKACVRFVSV